jgi:hypothetical protein
MTITENPFQPAAKEAVKARIALTGPSGSGKTYTALMLATNLAERVAGIDTERNRMREHQRHFQFDHLSPDRFDPRDLVKLLSAAAANGYGAVVIDSFSHYWMGSGGALEFVDANTKTGGSKFSEGWNKLRPHENAMLEAIMSYPGHVIATMRVKTAYELQTNDRGKQQPVKVGLKPEQREGIEYEFSIVGEMSQDHTLRITKTTCDDLADAEILKPGPDVASVIAEWCSDGTPTFDAIEYRDQALESSMTYHDLLKLHRAVKGRRMLGAAIVDELGDETTLGAMIVRLGQERKPQMAGASA